MSELVTRSIALCFISSTPLPISQSLQTRSCVRTHRDVNSIPRKRSRVQGCTQRPVSTSTLELTSQSGSISRDRKPQGLTLPATYVGSVKGDATLLRVEMDIDMNGEKKEVLIKLSHLEKSDIQLALSEEAVTRGTPLVVEFEHDVVEMSKFVHGAYTGYVWKKVNDEKFIDVGEEMLMLKSAMYTGGAYWTNVDRSYRAYGHGDRTENKVRNEWELNYWKLRFVDESIMYNITDYKSLKNLAVGESCTFYMKVDSMIETVDGVILKSGGLTMETMVGVPAVDSSSMQQFLGTYVFISGYKTEMSECGVWIATGSGACVSLAPKLCVRRMDRVVDTLGICQTVEIGERKVSLKSVLPKPSKGKDQSEKIILRGTRANVSACRLRDESGGTMKLNVDDEVAKESEGAVEEWIMGVRRGGFNLNDCGDTVYVMDQDQRVVDVKSYYPWDVRQGQWVHFE